MRAPQSRSTCANIHRRSHSVLREYTPCAVIVAKEKNSNGACRSQYLDMYIASLIRAHASKLYYPDGSLRVWRQPLFDHRAQGFSSGIHLHLLQLHLRLSGCCYVCNRPSCPLRFKAPPMSANPRKPTAERPVVASSYVVHALFARTLLTSGFSRACLLVALRGQCCGNQSCQHQRRRETIDTDARVVFLYQHTDKVRSAETAEIA